MRKCIFLIFLLSFNSFFAQKIGWYHSGGTTYNTEESVRLIAEIAGFNIKETEIIDEKYSPELDKLISINQFDVLFLVDCNSHPLDPTFYYSRFLSAGGLIITDYYAIWGDDNSGIISRYKTSNVNRINFSNALEYRWLNDENEMLLPLSSGDQTSFPIIASKSFTAEKVASFEDSVGVIFLNSYGAGKFLSIGPSFKRLVTFPRNNRDLSAQRSYSNGFEPGADIIPLLIRGIIEDHFPVTVWKHTLPRDYKSVLTITHDVDDTNAYEDAYDFLAFEKEHNIPVHYFLATKYLKDNRSEAFYTDADGKGLLQALQGAGMTVGSQSVGAFKDFNKSSVFPLGTTNVSKETYFPFYDGNSTLGGTVLGELMVSKQILERDGTAPIHSFRSSGLKFNKYLPEGLETAGYTVESSFRANDVMTGFPYFLQKEQRSTERLVDVLEIPVHLSDAVDHMNSSEYEKAVDIWEDVIEKYSDNYAPVTLSITPDRSYKLEALKELLTRLEGKTELVGFEDLADFWRERCKLSYHTDLDSTNKVLTITIPESVLPISSHQSLHITKGKSLDSISVVSDTGRYIAHHLLDWDETSYLLRFESGISDFDITQKSISCEGVELELSLADTSSAIDSVLWDFGDNTSAILYDLSPVTHSYTLAQTYRLNLRIYADGVITDVAKNYDVILAEAPQADFVYVLADTSRQVPLDIYLYNQTKTSEGDSLSFSWSIQKNGFSVESQLKNFKHQFTTPGTYSLQLDINNKYGCSSTYQEELEVLPHVIASDSFTVTLLPQGCMNVAADFEVETLVSYDSLLWDFGDSTSMMIYNANSVSHQYDSSGTYDVSLTLWNYGSKKILNREGSVNIPAKPQAAFSLEVSDTSYVLPLIISGLNTSVVDVEDSVTYQWTITGVEYKEMYGTKDLNHTFAQAGDYSIALELTSAFGCSSVYSKEVKVKEKTNNITTIEAGVINISPNPTRDKVLISVEKQTKNVLVEFYDLQGEQLSYHENIAQPIAVPVSKGLCIVKITIDGKSYLTKVMKW